MKHVWLITFLFPVFGFAATPGFDTQMNYDTVWMLVYDGGMGWQKSDLRYSI